MSEDKFTNIKNYYEDLYNLKKGESFPFDYKRYNNFIKDIESVSDDSLKSLDIGCGVGYACQLLQDKGYEPHGIDISESALIQAKENLPKGTFKLAKESGDIDYEDNYFDVIICLGVLEHITNPEDVVKEAYRVLKPGGIAIFSVPNSLSPYFYFGNTTGQILEIPQSLTRWKSIFVSNKFNVLGIKKDVGPSIEKKFKLIKKLKISIHKLLNLLPMFLTYQFIFKLQKPK